MAAMLALAGDTMLGRGVAERIREDGPASLFGPRVRELTTQADAVLVNLECCVSDRGERWPAPGKPFFFRAPPAAVDALVSIGVTMVTLANNHALDYGHDALADTLTHLGSSGIAGVGAGPDLAAARHAGRLDVGGTAVSVLGLTDHPADFAATADRPGVAFADLWSGVPAWVTEAVGAAAGPVLVVPHWGPNMVPEPVDHVRRAAAALDAAGADLVAGSSAHVFHGVAGRVLFDLGDFVDDYARDPRLRNDVGLLWLLHLEDAVPRRVEVVPLHLRFGYTEVAHGEEARWARRRFATACRRMGTEVREEPGGWPVVELGA